MLKEVRDFGLLSDFVTPPPPHPPLSPGGFTEQLRGHVGFVTIVSLSVIFVTILAVLSIILVITCWHYKVRNTLPKSGW